MGEMTADIALDFDLMKARYPFCNLTGPANILVMPGLHAANISFKLVHQLGNVSVVGPMMIGGEQAFQIVQMGASVSDIVQTAVLAAHDAIRACRTGLSFWSWFTRYYNLAKVL